MNTPLPPYFDELGNVARRLGLNGNGHHAPSPTGAQTLAEALQGASPVEIAAMVDRQSAVHIGPVSAESDGLSHVAHWRKHGFALGEFLQRPPKEWLVRGLFGLGDAMMIFGLSNAGKSFVAIDLALACATGRPFAGCFPVTRPLVVAYCIGEGVGGFADRLRAATHGFDLTGAQLYIYTDVPQLFDGQGDAAARAFVHAWQTEVEAGKRPAQLDVLIVDTYHTASVGVRENDAGDAGRVTATLRMMREALGCVPVLIHHAGKNGEAERGSGALRNAFDMMVRVAKVGNAHTMECDKAREDEFWPAQAFSLVAAGDSPSVRVTWHGAANGTIVESRPRKAQALHWLRTAGGWHTAADVARSIGMDEESRAIYEYLDALVKAGDVEQTGGRPRKFRALAETAPDKRTDKLEAPRRVFGHDDSLE
jgi:hypothetical protein